MTSLLQQWVTGQAERRPDATAVVMEDARLTYEQLEASSNQLAHCLKAAGCERGDRVCLLLPKSPVAIVSLLGILKADCSYIPVDPASPAARVTKIVHSGEPRVILASSRAASLLDELLSDERLQKSVGVGWVDDAVASGGEHCTPSFSLEDVRSAPTTALDYRNNSMDPAHILFTSGSTGAPKGVVIPHRNVIHFVEWATQYFGTAPTDRISGHPPLHFDLSTFDVFGTFAAGAQLYLVAPEINVLPTALADPHLGTHPMVLGAVAAQLPGQVRRGEDERFPHPAAAPMVRRGLPHARPAVLDDTVASRDVHEPIWTDRDHDRQQLLPRAQVPRG
jgi:non-ribosomal peptide synthetase component F